MKRQTLSILLACLLAPSLWAADWVDTATVVSSSPIVERVMEPQEECWIEKVRSYDEPVVTPARVEPNTGDASVGGAIVGGLVGGVLGHQVGKGRGNTAATVVGAIAGSVIGGKAAAGAASDSRVSEPAPPRVREEQRCRQIERYREVIKGYKVVYLYKGQEIQTQLPYQPGKTLQVGISVLEGDDASLSLDRERHTSPRYDNKSERDDRREYYKQGADRDYRYD